jgi:hypothetical protein
VTAALALLERLQAAGFWLQPDLAAGRIVISPASALTEELRAQILEHKTALLRALTPLPPDLEQRIRAMAARWEYSNDDLVDVLQRARLDPASWTLAVEFDEDREALHRQRGRAVGADA